MSRTLVLKCTTNDDLPVFVTGSTADLGHWNPDQGLAMQLQSDPQGHRQWVVSLDLHPGQTIEYKFVKKSPHGPVWEAGGNRSYTSVDGPSSFTEPFRTS